MLSAVAVHGVRYWPVGHKAVLHGEQAPAAAKNPATHCQSQASAPYGLPADVYCEFGGPRVHATHCPFADAVHADRYCPAAQEVVSQATHDEPTLKYPDKQEVGQLVGSAWLPGPEKTPLTGRFVQGRQVLSACGMHADRYLPAGHGAELHGEQIAPFRKKPLLHCQSQVSELYGLPGDV